MAFPYPFITLEEHFLAQAARDFYSANGTTHPDDHDSPTRPKLLEIGDERLKSMDVPIYLHPNLNEQTKPLLYDGSYSEGVATSLSRYGWGWLSETAISFLRLFAAGLYDAYLNLKIVLGHLGKMLPFQLDRIQGIANYQWPTDKKLRDV